MLLHDQLVVLLPLLGELDLSPEPALGPEKRSTASETHMREDVVVAYENLLGLDEIGTVEGVVDASAAEAGPRHVLAPTADCQVHVAEEARFVLDFPHVALHDRDPPGQRQPVTGEYLQQVLVPEVLALCGHTRFRELLGVGEGDVLVVAEVEVVGQDSVFQPIQHFLALGLVERTVQEPMLEGDELDTADKVEGIVHELAHGVTLGDQAQVGLLHDGHDAHDQVHRLRVLGGDVVCPGLKLLRAQLLDFGGQSIDHDALFLGECLADCFELR